MIVEETKKSKYKFEKENKVRDPKLDIIRIFSLSCVIGVHFFLNSGFYDVSINDEKMIIMYIFRSIFIIAVPMFITLTGYLMNQKRISKKYYKGILKVLSIYFICSVLYFIFMKFYKNESANIKDFVINLLSYKGTRYSWYIEMYIGLYLIIPFLNIIVNNLNNKKEFQWLLITLIVVLGIPNVLNYKIKILPSWWTNIYPVFYYFLGAYINKYKNNISSKNYFILLVIAVISNGILDFAKSNNNAYIMDASNYYASATMMFITYLTFTLITKINLNNNIIRDRILKIISESCLGAYLISCCFDDIFYSELKVAIPSIKDRFICAPIIIIIVLICSISVSIIINYILNFIKNMYTFRLKKSDNI